MAARSVTVLGGGNTAFSVAANLSLDGWQVTLGEIPSFAHAVEPVLANHTIRLDGMAHRGEARIEHITTNLADALAANDLVLLIVPAYAHEPFATACAADVRAGQTIVLLPGTLGCLEFLRIVGRRQPDLSIGGPDGLTVAETDTAPYVCRKLSADSAHIWGVAGGMGLGVFPARETERVLPLVEAAFPGVRPYADVLQCGLSAMNPVVHPAGVLMNAGRIERARGEFYFYDEGVTPSVCRAIEAVDAERLAIGRALDMQLSPVAESFFEAGFGPNGNLWSTINGSAMLTALRAPGAINTRWLTEDLPYGLAVWCRLAEVVGVPAPVMRSLVDLGSAVLEMDCWTSGRMLEDLGLDVDRTELLATARG